MRVLLSCALFAGLIGVVVFACNPNSIGRPCVNPGGQAVTGVQLSSPALECPSRLCLIEPAGASSGNVMQASDAGAFRATCTASCNSDSDCSPETNDYCKDSSGNPLGYVCAVVSASGPFCCKKVCVCRGDLDPKFNGADGGARLPPICDPVANPLITSTCANVKTK